MPRSLHERIAILAATAVRAPVAILALIAPPAFAVVLVPRAGATFLGANGRIAFARSAPGGGQHIWSITPSSHGLRRLTDSDTLDFTPSWSPGGTLIAFSRLSSSGGLDVFFVRAGGAGLTQITHGPPGTANGEPAWSPDAGSIAFTRGPFAGGAPSQIYRMRLDGTGLTRLTNSTVDSRAATWTNGLIAYVQGEPPRSSIWTMRPDGSHQRRLSGLDSATDHPDFSPTGAQIAFDKQLGKGSSAIYVMDRNGRHVRRVSGTRGVHEDPVFSPDATRIAFAAGPRSRLAIDTTSVRGAQLHRVTGGGTSSFQPSWQSVLIAPR